MVLLAGARLLLPACTSRCNSEAEARQTLDSIGIILREANMSYANVVSVQVYLTDMELFQRMNAVYTTYFKEQRPSRTTVGVTKLAAPGARIEITATARR